MNENAKPLSGNHTRKAKVNDVVVRSPDVPSLSDSKSVANVDKLKLSPAPLSGREEEQEGQQETTRTGNSTISFKVHLKNGAKIEDS